MYISKDFFFFFAFPQTNFLLKGKAPVAVAIASDGSFIPPSRMDIIQESIDGYRFYLHHKYPYTYSANKNQGTQKIPRKNIHSIIPRSKLLEYCDDISKRRSGGWSPELQCLPNPTGSRSWSPASSPDEPPGTAGTTATASTSFNPSTSLSTFDFFFFLFFFFLYNLFIYRGMKRQKSQFGGRKEMEKHATGGEVFLLQT